MAQPERKNTNTKDIKILILVGALVATIAGWAGMASQDNTGSIASTTPAVETASNQTTLQQPVVRRAAPAPLTTTRSSR